MNASLLHPRDEIMQTMERIYRYRMTTTSGGNLSIRDGENVWITPARIDKGSLRRDDIVSVARSGDVTGPHRPSSEFPFHQSIYDRRPDFGGIVHAHPVALVAFSIAGQVPNTALFPQARHVCGKVGFAPYALPGSQQLADNIANAFEDSVSAVVLENHGVVVGGSTLQDAYQRFETLEFLAKILIKAGHIGEVNPLTDSQFATFQNRQVDVAQSLSSNESSTSMSSAEKELRRQLKLFVRRGCRQRLLISTEGSFSARLGEDSFLITPSQQDREQLDLADFVRVEGDECESDKTPSRASRAHQAIYRRYPDVQSIVFAHPVNATAFSVTQGDLDARTIPESYLFLRDVRRLPFGLPYQETSKLAENVSLDRPVALLENDGVLVVGTSVLDAFDRLEVLEATAEALINTRPLGPVTSMSEEVIQELRTAFLSK